MTVFLAEMLCFIDMPAPIDRLEIQFLRHRTIVALILEFAIALGKVIADVIRQLQGPKFKVVQKQRLFLEVRSIY